MTKFQTDVNGLSGEIQISVRPLSGALIRQTLSGLQLNLSLTRDKRHKCRNIFNIQGVEPFLSGKRFRPGKGFETGSIDFFLPLQLNAFQSTKASCAMNLHHSSTEILFRSSPGKPDGEVAEGILLDEEREMEPEEEESIFCRKCRHTITRPSEVIQVNGQHNHTFANPHGQIFEIGCFQTAEGCGHVGQKTAEWSWFKGFSWRVAVCGKCLVQMGWIFISSKGLDNFHGLILERLVFPKG